MIRVQIFFWEKSWLVLRIWTVTLSFVFLFFCFCFCFCLNMNYFCQNIKTNLGKHLWIELIIRNISCQRLWTQSIISWVYNVTLEHHLAVIVRCPNRSHFLFGYFLAYTDFIKIVGYKNRTFCRKWKLKFTALYI